MLKYHLDTWDLAVIDKQDQECHVAPEKGYAKRETWGKFGGFPIYLTKRGMGPGAGSRNTFQFCVPFCFADTMGPIFISE